MAQSSTKTTSNGNGNATTHLHHQQAQQQQQQQKVRKVLVENRGTGHLVQYNQRSSISSISTVSANSSSSISSSSSGSSGSSSGSRSNNREKEAVVAGSGATPQQPQHQHQQHRPQQQPRTVASVNIRKKHQSERANNNHSLASRRPANLDLRPVKNSLPKSASLPSVIPRHGILKSSSDSSSPQRKPQQAPTKCRSFSSLLQQLRHPSRKSASCSRIYDPTTAAATAVAPLIAVRHSSNESSPVSPYKSVSFSPDTSFVSASEARPSQKRKQQAKLHSCAGYRQGVLADDERLCNLPSSWEEALGGPKALLIAAQDADDDVVRRIVNLVGKAGLGDIDVNARDPSGRTAISYMAGNGSALVLEACLGFPGADANLPDNEANTPLHFAAQAGQTECVNILLQRCPSIEVDARNSLGFTPLMKAALQGRTKCAKILLFAGANPTLRDHGRGFRAEQWARFCGRYVCAEVIERFARHRLLEKSSSCRWGSEPELAAQILQGKFMAMPPPPQPVQHHGTGGSLKSKFRRVFRTASNSERSTGGGHGSGHAGFSLVSQLTSAALCASSPVLPKSSDVSPVVKSLLRPLSVPQLRVTLVAQDAVEIDRIDAQLQQQQQQQQSTTVVKPARTKKKNSNNST